MAAPMRMNKMEKCTFLIICIISTLMSYSVFLKSFISSKEMIGGYSSAEEFRSKLLHDYPHLNPHIQAYDSLKQVSLYSHVVIVLIDALRIDFTNVKYMPFLNRRSTLGLGSDPFKFVAKVQPPTVTLPRIKALTTGSIPGFVDVVLNFGSASMTEDNILTQMKNNGKSMIFYGDDTWLSLFPEHFTRSDGTVSFFVTDYTEVDDNVTRHLDKELEAADFNLMILHYLGLDHIGHTAGPFSPLIGPKLLEMDNIIKKIYTELSKKNESSLIMICGDHGMSDQGGHGGATESETKVPVIFLTPGEISTANNNKGTSKPDTVREIEQIDIAPTLSFLLGVPIPKNNLGTVVTETLSGMSLQQKIMALMVNGLQVSEVLKQNMHNYDIDKSYLLFIKTCKAFDSWLNGNMSISTSGEQGVKLIKQFEESIKLMASKVASSATKYDEYGLVVAILLLWLILFTLLLAHTKSNLPGNVWGMLILMVISVFCHITVCTKDTQQNVLLCDPSLPSLVLQIAMLGVFTFLAATVFHFIMKGTTIVLCNTFIKEIWDKGSLSVLFLLGTLLQTISLLSSSFVEEEHQTWYFYIVTAHLLILKSIVGKIAAYTLHNTNDSAGQPSVNSYNVENTSRNQSENDNIESYLKQFNSKSSKSQLSSQEKITSSKGKNPLWDHAMVVIVILGLCRVMRSWNQTGNKWLNIPDIGDYLTRQENLQLLSLLVVGSMVTVFLCKRRCMNPTQQILYGIGLVCVYLHKSANGSLVKLWNHTGKNGVAEAQCVYFVVTLYTLLTVLQNIATEKTNRYRVCSHIHSIFSLLILVLARPHNIVLIAMMVLQECIMEKYIWSILNMSASEWTVLYLWMGEAAFFYQGNSNSISTVDVSAGYVGLHDYQPVLVGLLLGIATYSGLIFWLLSLIKFIFWKSTQIDGTKDCFKKRLKKDLTDIAHILCISRALPLAVYTVLVTFMRYHLFVWTVFSPKLLYEGMLTLVLSVISLCILTCTKFL